MPQMMPMLWLILFFFFLSCLILFINLNYFISFFQPLKTKNLNNFINKKYWKLY